MINRFSHLFQLLTACCILLFFATSARADSAAHLFQPFIGSFEGEATSTGDELDKRFLRVSVEETSETSFHLIWETTANKSDGREKTSLHEVEFQLSERDGIFSSAMRKNMFGKWQRLNPMKGDPYIWAKIEDRTMIVYAMIITEDGGYEMQQYNRKLVSKDQIELTFQRIRDGVALKTVTGILDRIN
ncbi:MAG: hypothetical protein R3261_03750 [Alphaproteobacteria bacterium]|nr:hypothetical protein [Alphaproteobacteria bacterium]